MKVSILVPLVFGIFTKISATPLVYDLSESPVSSKIPWRCSHCSHLDTNVCDGAVTIASTWIGEAKNVEMKSVFCPNSYQRRDVQHVLEQPQTNPVNVCGAPCRFSHDFCLDSRNLFLFQVPRSVSRQKEASLAQMNVMSSLTPFASTVKE